MVYKLANISDLDKLSFTDHQTWKVLYELTSVLTSEYGADRNVDTDDGGYVLYVTPGTSHEEIQRYFNYSAHPIEYVNWELTADPPLCSAMYILNNDYSVIIVMPLADAPAEIIKEF